MISNKIGSRTAEFVIRTVHIKSKLRHMVVIKDGAVGNLATYQKKLVGRLLPKKRTYHLISFEDARSKFLSRSERGPNLESLVRERN